MGEKESKINYDKYKEIWILNEYCQNIGIKTVFEPLYDGYAIRFPNGSDIVQHFGSYDSNVGCVEPAIGCRLDYRPVKLARAKVLVKYHKGKLNNDRKRKID